MKTSTAEMVPNMVREAYLKEVIKLSGIPQSKIAKDLAIPASTITSIMKRGIAGTALDTVVRICDYLNIDIDDFVHGRISGSSPLAIKTIDLAMRIRETRCKLRFRQAAVASKLGISLAAYQNIESATHFISPEYIKQLSKVFGVPVEYLYKKSDTAEVIAGLPVEPEFDRNERYDFSQAIISLRQSKGLSQTEFANQLNVSEELVADWESDIRVPALEHIAFIATKFNVKPNSLYIERTLIAHDSHAAQLTTAFENASERDKQLICTILGIEMDNT